MKFSLLSVAAALAAVSQAAPGAATSKAHITFIGAAGASFSQDFPTDGSVVPITNPLSISHIASKGGATCTFYGIDGSVTTVVGAETVDVGPPQTQIKGTCWAL
ncbi:hypothetical protein VTN00DRAFT_4784 [Thermoascus crustaceus]|uniref:uncharacterized protein n=1 Tax=Thermoascus crustaceus TaxID=5088 RepID=UPI0037430A79